MRETEEPTGIMIYVYVDSPNSGGYIERGHVPAVPRVGDVIILEEGRGTVTLVEWTPGVDYVDITVRLSR